MSIQVGDHCPIFKLKDQFDRLIDIKDSLYKKYIVIYFYPKDFTSGCTAEACYFRDNYEVFNEMGCEVFGISHDSVGSHLRFSKKHELNFSLLSDPLGKVRRMFGVPKSFFGLIPGRVTYLIDKKGIVRGMFDSRVNPWGHIKMAIEKLKEIQEKDLSSHDSILD